MTTAEAALIAAVIAGSVALTGHLLTNIVAIRNERLRQQQAAREARAAEIRSRTGDAFKQLLAIQHSIEWVTWHAKHDPESIRNPELVAAYDEEVHEAYPAFLGAFAAATSLSPTVHDDLKRLLDRVYYLDHEVALGLRAAQQSAKFAGAIQDLTRSYEEITQLLEYLLEQLPRVLDRAAADA